MVEAAFSLDVLSFCSVILTLIFWFVAPVPVESRNGPVHTPEETRHHQKLSGKSSNGSRTSENSYSLGEGAVVQLPPPPEGGRLECDRIIMADGDGNWSVWWKWGSRRTGESAQEIQRKTRWGIMLVTRLSNTIVFFAKPMLMFVYYTK